MVDICTFLLLFSFVIDDTSIVLSFIVDNGDCINNEAYLEETGAMLRLIFFTLFLCRYKQI